MIGPTALTMGGFAALGLAAAPHCGATCGLMLAGVQSRHRHHCTASDSALEIVAAQCSRLCVIVAMGALAGWLGAAVWGRWQFNVGADVWMLGLIGVVGGAVLLMIPLLHRRRHAGTGTMAGAGALVALLPCPVFYAVLGYAALSGGIGQGALLALAYGLGSAVGAVLVMTVGLALVPRLPQRAIPVVTGLTSLTGLALLGVLLLRQDWLGALCVTG